MKLDPFYLIVDSAEWIERLVPLGVKLVQLRIKDRTEAEIRAEIRTRKGDLRRTWLPADRQRLLATGDRGRMRFRPSRPGGSG